MFGMIGYLMKYLGYSRSSLLIGFVLGAVLEKNLFLAIQIDGPYFILEPVPLALSFVTIGFLLYNLWAISRNNAEVNKQPSVKPLEMYLVSAAGIVFTMALLAAMSYDTLPARTPVFILLPLLILTVLQINRTRILTANGPSSTKSTRPVFGRENQLGKVLQIFIWTVLLLGLIVIAGHYAGIVMFMFLLLKVVSKKEVTLALAIAASVTLVLYILFEIVFDIELYRGLVYRIINGYKLF